MSKHNFFVNFLKKINISINSLLEKKLNKLNFLFDSDKLLIFLSFKRIFGFISALLVIIFSYLSLPYFYNTNYLVNKIKSQLSKNLNINFVITNDFTYNFFPRPNFVFKNTKFYTNKKNFADVERVKIYISPKHLFSLNNLKIDDVIIDNVNFNLDNKNFDFFTELLENNFSNFDLQIDNSNIFYRNIENDVLFINKINQLKYYFDLKDQKNTLLTNSEIFNVPYTLEVKDYTKENKIISKINFDFLNLKVINELSNKVDQKNGLIKFIYNKDITEGTYKIEKKSFDFNLLDKSLNSNFEYKGKINFIPFFSEVFGNIKKINLNKIFNSESIFIQLLKTELLNNKNLNIDTIINAEKILPYNDLINLVLNLKVEEGLVDINNTKLNWSNNVDFQISNSLLYVRDNNLVLDGNISIDIYDVNKIYKYFKTPRNYRKEISKIKLNFAYNFDQKVTTFNNIEIDGSINQKVNQIFNQFVSKDTLLQNRVYFKNLINEAFKSYAG
tara:strand:+ start:49 stop:1551 length:1503 start_codon:yes stop_codon:yes gene_type:complete